jgi:hypothetical protein
MPSHRFIQQLRGALGSPPQLAEANTQLRMQDDHAGNLGRADVGEGGGQQRLGMLEGGVECPVRRYYPTPGAVTSRQ